MGGLGVGVRTLRAGVIAAMATASLAAAAPARAAQPTRYSIAGGCYSLSPAKGGAAIAGASQLRFKATDLGSYMLFGPAHDFVAASGGSVAHAAAPSPAADWRVTGDARRGFELSPASAPGSVLAVSGSGLAVVPRDGAGPAGRFRFVPASGCAAFPEPELNVTGQPTKGPTPYGETRGVIDGHMHWMTFELFGQQFHCGRAWDRYGAPAALPDCSSIEGPQGASAPIQNFLNYGQPAAPHDTTGWPKLASWDHSNYTYEGTYYRWVERAWRAGLRLIVMPAVDNRELCQLNAERNQPCSEFDSVLRQIDDIYAMQDYVDAQAGGPGKGFFRIVRNPFQARRVINRGKMAVVLEVEVSEPFDCRGSVPSSCSNSIIDRGLDELYDRGVRSSLLLNKFDNPLSGVRFDSGVLGLFLNAGNRDSYGSFWSAKTCDGPEHDNTIDTGLPPPGSPAADFLASFGIGPGTLPTYPPPPHCNTRGLTELGRHMVRGMMDRGMIVNPDHMSQQGVDDTLTIAESRQYSGVISPHGWMDPRNWPRIWKLGGIAFPNAGSAEGFVKAWRAYRPKGTPYFFGWGYGADMGGLGTQGEPPAPGSPNAVDYPFKSYDGGTTVSRERSGDRVFDYDRDGVATYGQYPEWLEEVRKAGGPKVVRDMLHGSEAYLEMWERAAGVPSRRCQGARARFGAGGLGPIRLGLTPRKLLMRAGQPVRRQRAWVYCVSGKGNSHAAETAVMTPGGRVALVASDARRQGVLGVAAGDRVARLRDRAESIGGGVWVARNGGRTAAFIVRGGRVRTVAVAGAAAARTDATLRAYLRRVPRHGVARRPAGVVGAAPRDLSPARALPLTARHGPSQFPFLCAL
ncbi:MAG: hypothetical protein ACJ75R_09865 [Solirubrobacterales bacterium]